jgi:trehalose synthase
MQTIAIPKLSFDRFSGVLGERGASQLQHTVEDAHKILGNRIVWHVNSTAAGGGVAEMLQTLLGYERGAGLDARWLVIEGDTDFFALTKRIHNRLHGKMGDGGDLGDTEHNHYQKITRRNAIGILRSVRPGDVVVLHDPQTAGLASHLAELGASVVWRCHIGRDEMNEAATDAWAFLKPYLQHVDAFIFSRACYVPSWLASHPVFIIPPAIDAFSVKNEPMRRATCRSILNHIGLLDRTVANGDLDFVRLDGSTGRVERKPNILQVNPIGGWDVPMVVQVSRWDPLKDMAGVMHGFANRIGKMGDAHLVLVGPDVSGVTDDPEGTQILEDCVARWHKLTKKAKERVHLVCLPMDDVEENAVMVNAIQRHATMIIQKSLHEGFGLTVTEAMWKARPIIASAVGGIQDQIVDEVHGLLLEDPTDMQAMAKAIQFLLENHSVARRLGRNARRRAIAKFLGPRQLIQFVDLLYALEGKSRQRRAAYGSTRR